MELVYFCAELHFINKIQYNMAKTKVNIQPLADRVVVKAAEAETKTKSGIIIPDSIKKTTKRRSSSSRPGKKDELTTVKVGDTVLYGKYSGTEMISMEQIT